MTTFIWRDTYFTVSVSPCQYAPALILILHASVFTPSLMRLGFRLTIFSDRAGVCLMQVAAAYALLQIGRSSEYSLGGMVLPAVLCQPMHQYV